MVGIGRTVSSGIIKFSVRVVQVVSSGLAPYKLPRALDSLLIYQQPSSTTLYYSHLGMLTLIKVRPWNETGEITSILTRLSLVAQSRAYGLLRPGDVQPTTGNCYLAVISTVFVNHIALLLRTIILYRTKECLSSFVCVSHFLKTVHA